MWQVTRCKRLTTACSNFFASLSPISSSFTSLMSPYLTIDEVSTLVKLQSPGAWLSADIERKIQFSLAHTVYSTGRTLEQLMAPITKPKILFPAPTIHCSPALTELSETSCGRRMTRIFWRINILRWKTQNAKWGECVASTRANNRTDKAYSNLYSCLSTHKTSFGTYALSRTNSFRNNLFFTCEPFMDTELRRTHW